MHQEPASLHARAANILRLPFEFAACLAAEILAFLAHRLEASDMEKKSGAREALLHLSASAPLLALGLALRPFLPAFQQSIAEQAKSGRESFWASYDSQARDAAQLMQKAGLAWRWLRRRVQLLKATDWRSCRQMLVDSFHQLAAGLSSLRPGANQALKSTLDDVTRECDDAKALFQAFRAPETPSHGTRIWSTSPTQCKSTVSSSKPLHAPHFRRLQVCRNSSMVMSRARLSHPRETLSVPRTCAIEIQGATRKSFG
ncbi:unnamed protein product [Symbiodinium sp. CCMP2592]|nr:unnamed protein product [Symbiodinium sp. CCMP2592]